MNRIVVRQETPLTPLIRGEFEELAPYQGNLGSWLLIRGTWGAGSLSRGNLGSWLLIKGEFGELAGDGAIGKGSTFAFNIHTGPLIVLLGNIDDDTVGVFHFESD